MMKRDILIIIPYYGTLPEWFQLFLASCENTEKMDFLLLTNDRSFFRFPPNFKVHYEEFTSAQKRFKLVLGEDAYINDAYKICDYKSTFGDVYSEFLKGYRFWGHSDIDLIFGNIDKFLEASNYTEYDRTFPHGHFSIYRNSPAVNQLYKAKLPGKPRIFDFNFVKRTTYPCHFDEIGMNLILIDKGYKFYENSFSENVHFLKYNFVVGGGYGKSPALIIKKDNKILVAEFSDNAEESVRDIFYIHFQGRKQMPVQVSAADDYIICRDGFIKYDDQSKKELIAKYGSIGSEEQESDFLAVRQAFARTSKTRKLKREIITYPLTGICNIYNRAKSIRYLIKNGLY